LKAALAEIVSEDQTIIFALTAPIKFPAKTAAAIEGLVRDGLPDSEVRNTIHGNHVRLRRVAGVPAENAEGGWFRAQSGIGRQPHHGVGRGASARAGSGIRS
jgi:hypothetical protein